MVNRELCFHHYSDSDYKWCIEFDETHGINWWTVINMRCAWCNADLLLQMQCRWRCRHRHLARRSRRRRSCCSQQVCHVAVNNGSTTDTWLLDVCDEQLTGQCDGWMCVCLYVCLPCYQCSDDTELWLSIAACSLLSVTCCRLWSTTPQLVPTQGDLIKRSDLVLRRNSLSYM